MATHAGIECPVCHEEATEHVALLPLVDTSDPTEPKITLPHLYAVCDTCYRDQFKTKYGITPEEAPGLAPPDPKLFVPKKKK